MKILISEDNDDKFNDIKSVLIDFGLEKITRNKSINGTISSLIENDFDILILDMQMPRFEDDFNEEIETEAGIEILENIEFYSEEIKNVKVIVISSDTDIEKKLKNNELPCVHYDCTTNWEEKLKEELSKLFF